MKISLNLSIYPSARERWGLLWGGPLALAALVALLYFSTFAVRNISEYRRYHRETIERREQETLLNHREMNLRGILDRPEHRGVFREAQFVNTLIDRKHFSLTELLAKVAGLLPARVRLAGLALAQPGEEPVVRFTVVGGSEESVETFLSNLEDSTDFKDVAIINQGFEQESPGGGPVTVACTAQYVGGKRR